MEDSKYAKVDMLAEVMKFEDPNRLGLSFSFTFRNGKTLYTSMSFKKFYVTPVKVAEALETIASGIRESREVYETEE